VTISLNTQNNQVELTVEDDGCGLPQKTGKAAGMGLRVMNYRASMIGATVSVAAGNPCGTVVRCVMQNRPPAAKNGKANGRKPPVRARHEPAALH
jgi:signal transduction histidine kinase